MRPADHLQQAVLESLAVPRAMGVITDGLAKGIIEPAADGDLKFYGDITSSTVSSHSD